VGGLGRKSQGTFGGEGLPTGREDNDSGGERPPRDAKEEQTLLFSSRPNQGEKRGRSMKRQRR